MASTRIFAIVPINPSNLETPDELDEEIAVNEADMLVFSELVGDQGRKPFDGCDVWDKDRPDDKLKPFPADSPEGQAYLKEGLDETRREFLEMMQKIRDGLASLTDQEMLDGGAAMNNPLSTAYIRFLMGRVGDYRGPEIRLYSHEADGLFTQAAVDEALDTAKLFDDCWVWVVPAGVHF